MLFWLILLLQIFLRNRVGESSKQVIQGAWSTPTHHLKWWISHSRGIYRASEGGDTVGGGAFLILFKGFWPLCNVTRSSMLVVMGVLYLPLHFIIIINFIVNIIFMISIIIRIFIKSSLLFLWGKLTVWFCFFQFLHLS